MTPNILFKKTLALAIFAICILVPVNAQVGIGTTNPQATLHVKGNYVAPVYSTNLLLEQNFTNYTVDQTINTNGDCNTNGWVKTSTPPSGYECTLCTGSMLYINSDSTGNPCDQNATVKVNIASSTTTSVFISFDFKLVVRGSNDRLRVYLYNNSEDTSQLIYEALANLNGTATGTFPVILGDSYSIRFQYTGINAYGATVDNVKVTEQLLTTPGQYALKIEDNNANMGYVLTADGNGNASWQPIPGGAPFAKKSTSLMQFTSSVPETEVTSDLFFPSKQKKENNPDQHQLILDLQKALKEQELIIEDQNKKIKAIEKSLEDLNTRN